MFSFTKKQLTVAAFSAFLLAPTASFAAVQDVVRDVNGKVIVDSNGGCVRTMWNVDSTECEGAPAAVKKEQTKVKMAHEERVIYFDFNKATLTTESKAKLDSLVNTIKTSKQVSNVDIVGHADKIGTSSYNEKLSMKRAQTVKSYLQSKGYKAINKVEVRALGSSKPVTTCDAKLPRAELISCLAEDRRVEIMLNLVK